MANMLALRDILARRAIWLESVLAAGLAFAIAYTVMPYAWWGPDDGAYAHVAERILAGDILHRDVQDFHGGYVNFINAAALALFGNDILSLRWPLVFLTALQTGLAYAFTRKHFGRLPALFTAACLGILTYALNPAPSANWYALSYFIFLALVLASDWRNPALKAIIAGFLIGLIFFIRQPTGVFAGIGALLVLLMQTSEQPAEEKPRALAGAFVLGACFFVLGAYLMKAANWSGLLLFGLCPMIALAAAIAFKANTPWRKTAVLCARLGGGALLAAIPLIIYHLIHGSLFCWLNDILLVPAGMLKLGIFKAFNHFYWPAVGAVILPEAGWRALLLMLFWFLVIIAPVVLGAHVIMLCMKGTQGPAFAFAVTALFHGIVSLHYEVPIYLFYTTGFTLTAIVLTCQEELRCVIYPLILFVIVTGAAFQIGPPANQPYPGLGGARPTVYVDLGLAKASVKTHPEDRNFYHKALGVIDACTSPDDSIFAFPTDAEMYYLSGRRNDFRFFSTALGLQSQSDLENVGTALAAPSAPELAIYHVGDKYGPPYAESLLETVKANYRLIAAFDSYEFYKKSTITEHCRDIAGQAGTEIMQDE